MDKHKSISEKECKADKSNQGISHEIGQSIIDGTKSRFEFTMNAGSSIVNKAGILLTVELTALVAYLSSVNQDSFDLADAVSFFMSIGVILAITSAILLITIILPGLRGYPLPSILDENKSFPPDVEKGYYEKVTKRIEGAIKYNEDKFNAMGKRYLWAVISFFAALAVVIMSGIHPILFQESPVESKDLPCHCSLSVENHQRGDNGKRDKHKHNACADEDNSVK